MTFRDWAEGTRRRYRTQPVTTATRTSAKKLYRGIVRRTVDPQLGGTIWDRDDWDVCVICDAARVDMFRDAINVYDELPDSEGVEARWSNASTSIDWINRQFNDHPKKARRAGYVTANPFTNHGCETAPSADLDESQLGYLAKLYETGWKETNGVMTVPPEVVTDHAIDVWRRRDELGIDRLVVHYMQPHEPFRARPEWGSGDHALLEDLVADEPDYAGASVYPRVKSGDVPLDEFRTVYLDNHHWVLEDIADRLVNNLNGRVAITADHGNALGEWGEWHHPPASIVPTIRRVPWVSLSASDRQTVQPDLAECGVDASTEDRLEALGYA